MKTKSIKFKNSAGELLSGKLELPIGIGSSSYAIFAHCFTCNKNLTPILNISRALAATGIGLLRFDFTGLGESDGSFSDSNFSGNVDDLVSAAQYIKDHHGQTSLLIGHSLGGAAVIKAATKIPDVQAIATIGAPSNPEHVKHLIKSELKEILSSGEALVNIGGRNFKIKKQFLDDLNANDLSKTVANKGKALLVLHSPQDQIVNIDNAANIYKNAVHPKSFISLDGADHLLSLQKDSLYVGTTIANWAKRYIEVQQHAALSSSLQVVTQTALDGYTTIAKSGNHFFIVDEPESVGGKNLGPGPYDYLLAALGSCTSMTLRMYADRKKWPLHAATVHLSHKKMHHTDCLNCESVSGYIDVIEREINLEGPLNEEQKNRLLEIADRCPVHKTLHNEIKVNTNLTN